MIAMSNTRLDVAISKYLRVRLHTILLVMTSPLYFSFFSLTTFVALVQSGIVWQLLEHQIGMTLSEMWMLARSMVVALGVESLACTIGSKWQLELILNLRVMPFFYAVSLMERFDQCVECSVHCDRVGRTVAELFQPIVPMLWDRFVFSCVLIVTCIFNHIMSSGLVW